MACCIGNRYDTYNARDNSDGMPTQAPPMKNHAQQCVRLPGTNEDLGAKLHPLSPHLIHTDEMSLHVRMGGKTNQQVQARSRQCFSTGCRRRHKGPGECTAARNEHIGHHLFRQAQKRGEPQCRRGFACTWKLTVVRRKRVPQGSTVLLSQCQQPRAGIDRLHTNPHTSLPCRALML